MDDRAPLTEENYWSKPCTGCGNQHTNLECVTQVAANVGMTVEEAKKVFVPQGIIASVQVDDKWVNWSAKHKAESE